MVGTAYQALPRNRIKHTNAIVLKDYYVLTFGLGEGSSDIISATSIEITPEMVGKNIAVFTAIEVKTLTGTATKEQLSFIDTVQSLGGIAGIARSPEDVTLIKNQFLNELTRPSTQQMERNNQPHHGRKSEPAP